MPGWIWTTCGWTAAALAVTGNVFVVRKNRLGYWFWICANIIFIVRNVRLAEWPQAALFAVYLGLAVWGWWSWRTPAKPRGAELVKTARRPGGRRKWMPWELN